MAFSVLPAALPLGAPAQQQAAERGDAVVVTASRFAEHELAAPIGMTVIRSGQIAGSSATTLPELLSREAGIVARDNSGSPDWQIDMRGFGVTGDQNTLVLIDGQRLSEIDFTPIRWSAIPLDSIERIEIMRGSGAVLYGGGATGGTINIITRSPRTRSSSATIGGSYGSYGTRETRGSLNYGGDSVGAALRFNDYASNNYRANNRAEQRNVDGELRWFGTNRHLAFKFGLDNQDLRLPGVRTQAQLATDPRGATTPRDFTTRDSTRASLGGGVALPFGEFAGEFGYRNTVRTSSQKDPFGFADAYLDTRVKVWSLTPRLKMPFEALGRNHSLVLGVDLDDWEYVSLRATSMERLVTPGAKIIASQRNRAFYAQNTTALTERTRLTMGARRQQVTQAAADLVSRASYANGTKTSTPRAYELALRHDVSAFTAVYGKAGESFRVATVDDIYAPFGGPFFDPIVNLLEPQRSRDHEIGAEYRSGKWRARTSAFASWLKNEIHFFAPTFANINLPPTRRQGLEFDLGVEPMPALSLFGNVALVEARFLDGTIGGVNVAGKTIPMVPRDTANAGFAWRFTERTQVSGIARYVGRQRYDNDQANTFPSLMPAYTVVDLKVTHKTGALSVSAAVNNLFDERYYTYAIRNGAGTSFNSYPQRERNFLVNAEYRF